MAFHSLREYVWGDDLRLVHWRSTARTGTLMIRHNVVPHEPRALILLDTSSTPYTDVSFEEAVRVAASLAVAAFDGGFPVVVRTTGGVSASGERGPSSRGDLLDLFAEVRRRDDDPGLATLAQLGLADDGAALGVVTGTPPAASLRAVSAVSRRFAMVSLGMLGDRVDGNGQVAPAGVFAVSASTSVEFAARWNRAVASAS